jgi:hypothetical protein
MGGAGVEVGFAAVALITVAVGKAVSAHRDLTHAVDTNLGADARYVAGSAVGVVRSSVGLTPLRVGVAVGVSLLAFTRRALVADARSVVE